MPPSPAVPPRSAAVLCRVTGRDPQRRKVAHASFFASQAGRSTLTNSATLFLARRGRRDQGEQQQQQQASQPELQVYAVCSADILAPFLHPAWRGSSSSSTRRPELLPGTRIDVLLESSGCGVLEAGVGGAAVTTCEEWWACELVRMGEVAGVDDAVDVLSQQGSDWELGWSKPNYPPPLYDARKNNGEQQSGGGKPSRSPPEPLHDAPSVPTVLSFSGSQPAESDGPSAVLYPNGRRRSAAQVAVLKVLRPRAEWDAEVAAAKAATADAAADTHPASISPAAAADASSNWPSHFPRIHPVDFPAFYAHPWSRACCGPVARGTPVSVTSSPYGLLSTAIFHNTLTRGIVANWVVLPADRMAAADGGAAQAQQLIVAAASAASSSTGAATSEGGAGASTTSHFARGWRSAAASTQMRTPPALLLLDARCFSGSEGAPVLLGPEAQPYCSAVAATSATEAVSSSAALCAPLSTHGNWCSDPSVPQPLLGMVTLPLRHTKRGSAVELTLAIPAARLASFLAGQGLPVWESPPPPPPSHRSDPAVAPLVPQASGRGEGWRMMQSVTRRRSNSPHAATSVATNGYGALLSSCAASTATPPCSVAAHVASPTTAASLAGLSSRPASASAGGVCALLQPSPSVVPAAPIPSSSATCGAAISAASIAVEHAERSVLMAKIGSSWASAIVLTADGYLLTNAHLLRPFLQSPLQPTPSTSPQQQHAADSSSSFTPSMPEESGPPPLLYDSAIRLQSHVSLTVRVEGHHLRSAPSCATSDGADSCHHEHEDDERQASATDGAHYQDDDAPPLHAVERSEWLPARAVYVSQGAWDVALLKVDVEHPLCPVMFHPTAMASASVTEPFAPSAEELPPVGSNVLVIGHALFPPLSSLQPTITAGVLSKVVRLNLPQETPQPSLAPLPSSSYDAPAAAATGAVGPAVPALLCTSAAVHNGNSGGLLVHESSGLFLGMVTCNVMHSPLWPHHFGAHVRRGAESAETDPARLEAFAAAWDEAERREEERRSEHCGSVILPHLNFSVPYTALLPLRQFCLNGAQAHDVDVLRRLDSAPALLSRLWGLQELDPVPAPQPRYSAKYKELMRKLEQEEAARQASLLTGPLPANVVVAHSKM